MKQNILITALLMAAPFVSHAADARLTCKGQVLHTSSEVITLTATVNEDGLSDVDAQIVPQGFTYYDSGLVEGRAQSLLADEDYEPRKYSGYERFDLSHLKDVQHSDSFMPMDQCQIQVLLPKDVLSRASFSTPMLVHCDQNGGSETLKCELN